MFSLTNLISHNKFRILKFIMVHNDEEKEQKLNLVTRIEIISRQVNMSTLS